MNVGHRQEHYNIKLHPIDTMDLNAGEIDDCGKLLTINCDD